MLCDGFAAVERLPETVSAPSVSGRARSWRFGLGGSFEIALFFQLMRLNWISLGPCNLYVH